MAKTYKILVNDGKGTDIKPVSVVQGAGAKGDTVRMEAKRGWRFEVQDDLKGKGLAPDQMRLKRMGKNLAIMFDGSQNADVLIEDFYADNKNDDKDNGMPTMVGLAENGGLYEYVPQDPATSSMPGALKDGNTPVIMALGGGPLAGDFVLAGLPLVAAAGGGIGGWLAGGAAVLAASAGGGGGGGAAAVAAVRAPAISIETDGNNDGYVNKKEIDALTEKTKFTTKTTLPETAVVGDTITVTYGTSTLTHVLTAKDITNNFVTDTFTLPAEGNTISVSAKLTSVATGVDSANATDTARLDTSAFIDPANPDPLNPVDATKSGLRVKIDTDANDDGKINNAENTATIKATVSLTTDAAVGDMVIVKATNNVDRTFTLTQADITAKKLVLTDLIKPAEGSAITVTASIKDEAGNKSPTPDASDSATLNTTSPLVRIIEDANNDGFINKDEIGSKTKVSVEVIVPVGAVAGNTINVVSGGTTIPHVLTTQDITNKSFTETFDKPSEGAVIEVKASFNGVDATDNAKLDTSAFVDQLDNSKSGLGVNIDSDGDNNGTITKAEFTASNNASKIKATISLTSDVSVGDLVTVTATGNIDRAFALTQAQVTAKKIIITDLTPPAEGGSIVVTASIKDAAGNKSPTPNAQDAAVLDTGVPNGGIAPVVEVVTDSGPTPGGDKWVNGPELNGADSFLIKAKFDPSKVAIGEKVVFRAVTTTSGIPTVESKEVEITQTDLTNGFATVTFAVPAKGRNLSVTALIKDPGGNASETSLTDDASLNELTAVADTQNVSASGSTETVKISGNVIAGDGGAKGKDIDHQFFGMNGYGTNVFVNGVKKAGATSFDALSANGGVIQGDFGTLTIKADGTYDYVLNGDAKVRALLRDEKVTEVFAYKVKDAGGNESETTLSIEVKGVNDQSKITLADVSILNVNSSADGLNGGQNSLKIEDPDAGQATFLGVLTQTASSYQGEYGKLTLTPTSTNESFTGYSWVYLKTPGLAASTSDTMRHDLFTFQSKDGTDSVTYDLMLSTGDADNLITKQVFHTSSTTGLKIASTSTSKTDTLVLDGAQLSFDFTTPTSVGATIPNITSIEKVDITGTGNNSIKLSLASLMQADAVAGVHKLFIDGNVGDVVNIANANIAVASPTDSGYTRYVFDSTHELLIQTALTTHFVS